MNGAHLVSPIRLPNFCSAIRATLGQRQFRQSPGLAPNAHSGNEWGKIPVLTGEEPRAHHKPKNEELGGKLNPKPAYRYQSSKMGHNQLQIARQVLKPYTKCVGREGSSTEHHACKQKPRHIWGYDQ